MIDFHVSDQLARYADGDLDERAVRRVEAHLERCARCRQELEDFRFAAGLMREVTVTRAPDFMWQAIESGLAGPRTASPYRFWPRLALASAAMVLLAAAAAFVLLRPGRTDPGAHPAASWEVVRHARNGAIERLASGTTIETARSDRVTIRVGDVGTVDVEPGTRIRLGENSPAGFRLSLAEGLITARITAPPRLFIVDTPASTVVDLGCAYTMRVDENGTGELQVTEGWTALEWKGRESLVPAGANARTRPRVGPGTPYFADASARLQAALERFDFAGGGDSAVEIVLEEARVRDTLTLWHLLSRVTPELRERVYDRIAALSPPPASVSRERVLELEPAMLTHWREELAWGW